MNNTIDRIVTTHCTNHIDRGEADAVWGEVLCAAGDVNRDSLMPAAAWRVITFDGRRGKQITLRPKEYGSRRAADDAFADKYRLKLREGYVPVEWTNQYYGLMTIVRDIEPDFFDMVVTEPTRIGMDLSSQLWRSISGLSGLSIPRQELIDNFNRSSRTRVSQISTTFTGGSIDLSAQRQSDIERENRETSGRLARDPGTGAHVFLWNGLQRDPNFEKCGVCNRKLSMHARLVVNYNGRLARHIYRKDDDRVLSSCRVCGLPFDGVGRQVHSARSFDNEIEYVSGPDATRSIQSTTGAETVTISQRVYALDPSAGELDDSELESTRNIIGREMADEIDRMMMSNVLGSYGTDDREKQYPPDDAESINREALPKSKPIKKPTSLQKPEPQSHERTGGLLDFDI